MTAEERHLPEKENREIVIRRDFEAPREEVFAAWTDPKKVAQWWGPEGFHTRVEELDLRPGGSSRYVMVGPDGTEYPVGGVYSEIEAPERIVTSDEFLDDFPADAPEGIVMTVLFEERGEHGEGTSVTLRIVHDSVESRRQHEEMGVVEGWQSSFDCLDRFLAER